MIHIYVSTYTIFNINDFKNKLFRYSKKAYPKNTAIFLSNDTKISEFKGIFDDKINQKIVNFLKKIKK